MDGVMGWARRHPALAFVAGLAAVVVVLRLVGGGPPAGTAAVAATAVATKPAAVATATVPGGATLKVNSSSRKAQADTSHVVADVTLTNNGPKALHYNPTYFKLKDGAGYEHAADLATSTMRFGDLPPGEIVSGTVVFEVPPAARNLTVTFGDGGSGSLRLSAALPD